jgi:hypothetical protein
MTQHITGDEVDARAKLIFERMGGKAGWLIDAADVAALIKILALSSKGMGIELSAVVGRLVEVWAELPDPQTIRQKMGGQPGGGDA